MYGDAHSEDEEEDCLLRDMPEKEAAMVIQHEAVAFLSYSKKGKQNGGKGSGKGKSFGPRFKKGSGKGKKGFRFGFRRNRMSVEDRKKKLAELKAKTRCTECNEKGHWAGDDACKLKKKNSTGKIAERQKILETSYSRQRFRKNYKDSGLSLIHI